MLLKESLRGYVKPVIIFLVAAAVIISLSAIFLLCHRVNKYNSIVYEECVEYNLDPTLVKAIIFVESRFKEDAVSDKGAIGLMQIMPSTSFYINGCSVDLTQAQTNVKTGVRYLKYLIERFGNADTAIAAYNAGEGNVRRWLCDKTLSANGITLDFIPFKETRIYVNRVARLKKVFLLLNQF